ncbi:MAG: glycosyltransferase [Bryobacteraceae bacterium]
MRILIAPNEDGLGTASWAVRLARAFLARPGTTVRIAAIKPSTVRFLNHSLEGSDAPVVQLQGVSGWIEMAKARGGVAVEATRERVAQYDVYRQTYMEAIRSRKLLDHTDLVIEMGVPPMAAAARNSVRAVTVFDHAWSLTLRRSIGPDPALAAIARDEHQTRAVHLFPEPVTPDNFADFWKDNGRTPTRIAGCFGGGDAQARAVARRALEIPRGARAVFVSGAGSPVWDGMLRRLVDQSVREQPDLYTVVFSPTEIARLGLRMRWVRAAAGWKVQCAGFGRILFVGAMRGETHHALTAAADLVVTRAGGGTVSDAIAHRVPLLLVEEAGQWQVEQIRHRAHTLGLARTVSLDFFRRQPLRCLQHTGRLTRERQRMQAIGTGAEHTLVRELLRK